MENNNGKAPACLMEELVRNFGMGKDKSIAHFVCVHDGFQPKPGDQGNDPKFFTRSYRFWIDGEFTNLWIKFKYDRRSGWSDMSISPKNMNEQQGLLTIMNNALKRNGVSH